MASDIRLGQLIAPFGPGSIYTDKNGVPNIICGLDFWFKKKDENGVWNTLKEAREKYVITEPRLSQLLNVPCFQQPPAYFSRHENPELSGLQVQTHRFPTWYFDNATGKLMRFGLSTLRLARQEKAKGQWRPVRFISVCAKGHLSDFPWKRWCGCTCPGDDGLTLNDTGGPDLRSVRVSCKGCNNGRTLAGVMRMDIDRNAAPPRISGSGLADAGCTCDGGQPWLGDVNEACGECPVAVLINQSNIYFSKTYSSIYLPDIGSGPEVLAIQDALEKQEHDLQIVDILLKLGERDRATNELRKIVTEYLEPVPSDEVILKAYQSRGRGGIAAVNSPQPLSRESSGTAFRRAEYNVLRNEVGQHNGGELRVLVGKVPVAFNSWLTKVNLVERLRETRVFYGFDRLMRSGSPLDTLPASAMQQLFREPPEPPYQWLPAVKSYGEGLYIELGESAIQRWLEENGPWLQARFDRAFVERMSMESLLLPPAPADCTWQWAARYMLVHTLAHILMNQLVFECGYASASLRERIFVSGDRTAPMAALLIYTAAGDSEGSLGGLVRVGRPELFEPMVRRAVSRASWCSADPVCSENLGGSGSRLVNLAACHACVLLPETACESINGGLDRAAIVGTPKNPGAGFLSDLIQRFEF